MSVLCEFDQSTHASIDDLHAYLRRFKISQKEYYTTYLKKVDRLTGEPIEWKTRDQYLTAEFSTKTNLKKWLTQNREDGLKWSKQWLANRKIEKGLIYPPSQVELRTMMCPSIPYYDSVGSAEGGYRGIAEKLGYETRYVDTTPVFAPLPRASVIIQDSREQSPLHFPSHQSKISALDVGDYAMAAPYDLGIRIERKSLADFCGTMSGRKVEHKNKTKASRVDSSYDRFDRELTRAKEANLYVVMMVESDINEAQSFGYLPHLRHIKSSASYVFHNMRVLLMKYPLHFQALFVPGRVEMVRVMTKLFEMGDQVRKIDLQHAYEEKGI